MPDAITAEETQKSQLETKETPTVIIAVPKKNCRYCTGRGSLRLFRPGTFSVAKVDGKKMTSMKEPIEGIPCDCLTNAIARAILKDEKLEKLRSKMEFKVAGERLVVVVPETKEEIVR